MSTGHVPRVLVVIPARGGSKGVPGKNVAPVGGIPLVARAVRACLASGRVTDVVVSTDDASIAAAAASAGADVVVRPAILAGDASASEAALMHTLNKFESERGVTVDVLVMVQCTSPFLTTPEVSGVVARVLDDGADTAHTVAPFHGFIWRESDGPAEAGEAGAQGVNHEKGYRLRRQDRPQEFVETGAAYAMRTAGFRKEGHRFFGRTILVPTDPSRVLEIDEPADLERAHALAPLLDGYEESYDEVVPMPAPTRADVDAVVIDFDGTQTDDRVWIDASGRETVAVHRGDGLGIAALRRAGLKVLILSTEKNPVVAARARKLNVPVLQGIHRKDFALKQWCEEQGVDPKRVLYAGNDVNDLPCFTLVGWPVAVADAQPEARAAARTTTTSNGGHGAVREIAAWLLGKELYKP